MKTNNFDFMSSILDRDHQTCISGGCYPPEEDLDDIIRKLIYQDPEKKPYKSFKDFLIIY